VVICQRSTATVIELVPKLRGSSGRAPSGAEKIVLQNAVTATDQKINALVHYGLNRMTRRFI
jgi:hypothetical protein